MQTEQFSEKNPEFTRKHGRISLESTEWDQQIGLAMKQAFNACLRQSLRYLATFRPVLAWRVIRDGIIIIRSNLFNYSFYCRQNPGEAWTEIHPLVHFLTRGTFEGKNPNPLFDASFYVEKNPDVPLSGMNPLAHFAEYGGIESRSPHPLFNSSFYLETYPDVSRAGINPLEHYLSVGQEEGRDPHPLFDSLFYLGTYPDAVQSRENPLIYYIYNASREHDPHPLFDTSSYLEKNPVVVREKLNPLIHFITAEPVDKPIEQHEGDGNFEELQSIKQKLDSRWKFSPELPNRLMGGNLRREVRHACQIWKGFWRNPFKAESYYRMWQRNPDGDSYKTWITENEQYDLQEVREEIDRFAVHPEISIFMLAYAEELNWLNDCIKSVQDQWYENWLLFIYINGSTNKSTIDCLKGLEVDRRIRIETGYVHQSPSEVLNSALRLTRGGYACMLRPDDALTPFALYEVAKLVNTVPTLKYIYSDEDVIDENGGRRSPFFKPDWSEDLFLSFPYTGQLSVFKRDAAGEVGGFREEYEPGHDYDLLIRLTESINGSQIAHIPKVLYHQRSIARSASVYSEANYELSTERSKAALQDMLRRQNIRGEVHEGYWPGSFRVKRALEEQPLISIIIPTKDKVTYLRRCIDSIVGKTTYPNYEIIVIDNNSSEPETLEYLMVAPALVMKFSGAFNFARINNLAVSRSKGKYLIFLNNDTEVITPDWIESMLEHAQRERVGVVGCKLLFPSNKIQHAGVVMGISGVAGHIFKFLGHRQPGYFGLANVIRNYSAVTAAVMMVRRSLFEEIGGFDENLAINFNDVDLCLRIGEKGYSIVYTPYAEMYHYESISRGDGHPEEAEFMFQKWQDIIENDPFYSPNLSRTYQCLIRTNGKHGDNK